MNTKTAKTRHIRTSVLIKKIENEIEKNQRRIVVISEHTFELRTALEALQALPANKPLTKADLTARDEKNKVGKFYDATYHEDVREKARAAKEAADKQAAEEAVLDNMKPEGTI